MSAEGDVEFIDNTPSPHQISAIMAARAVTARRSSRWRRLLAAFSCGVALFMLFGCATGTTTRQIMVTAYCDCGECNGYSTGSWMLLKLDRWNKRINYGSEKGEKYTGDTAAGGRLHGPNSGLISADTVRRPWTLPYKALPWNTLPRKGTIAADTSYYPFGTEMYIPGYGWGMVDDRGGAIKGADHIDIFMDSHAATERWGAPTLPVKIRYKR